jgi:hypothetical protein
MGKEAKTTPLPTDSTNLLKASSWGGNPPTKYCKTAQAISKWCSPKAMDRRGRVETKLRGQKTNNKEYQTNMFSLKIKISNAPYC